MSVVNECTSCTGTFYKWTVIVICEWNIVTIAVCMASKMPAEGLKQVKVLIWGVYTSIPEVRG